jgi:hypothetical protein
MIINSATMRMILYYLNKKSGVSGLLYIVEIDKITMQSGIHQHFCSCWSFTLVHYLLITV